MTPANPTPAALAALDLDAIKARRDAVMKLTFALAADGDRAFRMSIPLRQDDADVLLLKLCDDVDALLAAARQGEEDTARLDWMQSRCAQLSVPDYPRVWDVTPDGGAYHFTPLTCAGPTDLREALDAARAASQPEEVSRG